MHRPTNLLLKTPVLLLLTLLSWQGFCAEDSEEATAETEIICFAAQKKWVCAPAGQKQQAHDKAMQMVQDQPLELMDPPDSQDNQASQVEIKMLDMKQNIGEQVKEEPIDGPMDEASLQAAIKDFIPRDDTQTENPQAAEQETVAPIAENQQTNDPGAVQPPVTSPSDVAKVEKTLPSQATAPDTSVGNTGESKLSSTNNQFSYWQQHYAQSWSFQVIGTSNRHHLDQFIQDQGLTNTDYTVVKTQVNGADWWVVLSGLYDSREQALSQRHQLPSQLAANAWVRQIHTIVGEDD